MGRNVKIVKFRKVLADKILAGDKTSTWRMFDDKDLQTGDELEFVVSETLTPFAKARITKVKEKQLGDITELDAKGHETFESTDEMLATYRKYYGDHVTLDTLVKMINFELFP